MRNVFTIFQREIAAYFNSPIGYIYLIVFLLINTLLFMTPFFSYRQADMRQMFSLLPIYFCILIPLITMRLWAEESKENTIEMLLTFPMKPKELVLGKYLASVAFFLVSLALTFPLAIMIGILGKPDWGVILSSYLGAFLLGSFFLATGIFLSSLARDQIIAAILSLGGCFALFLIGTSFLASYLDSRFPGWMLGSLLKDILGATPHYETFVRGIISLTDIVYFIAWSWAFLFLNSLFIEWKSRQGTRFAFSTAIAICFGIGLVFNYLIVDYSVLRYDCTEGKMYTVSDSSKAILKSLSVPVRLNFYVTPKEEMPTQLQGLEQSVKDKLEELRVAAGGKLQYKVIHMQAKKLLQGDSVNEEKKKEADKSQEKTLYEKGVEPFAVRTGDETESSTRLIYSSLGVAYKEKKEEIIPYVTLNNMSNLEYDIVSTVARVAREKKPVIAVVAPKEDRVIPPYLRRFYEQQGMPKEDAYGVIEPLLEREGYEVKRVAFDKKEGLPESYDALFIVNPRKMNERQKWEVARALYEGKNVFLAVQNYTVDYKMESDRLTASKSKDEPEVNGWLEHYGIKVDSDMLMDANSITLGMEVSPAGNPHIRVSLPVPAPFHIELLSENMNQQKNITKRFPNLLYLWGCALNLDESKIKENKLQAAVLMSTSKTSWKVPVDENLENKHLRPPKETQSYPVMALLEGEFPNPYKDKDRPAWPKEVQDPSMPQRPEDAMDTKEPPVKEMKQGKGKLIVIGGATMFRQKYIVQGAQQGIPLFMSGVNLLVNSAEFLGLGKELSEVRSRDAISRKFTLPAEGTMVFWKVFHFAVIPGAIILIGISRMTFRRLRRERYALAPSSQK